MRSNARHTAMSTFLSLTISLILLISIIGGVPGDVQAATSARIDTYSPSTKMTVDRGDSFNLRVWFTNTGDAGYFYPGVSIWDSAPGTVGRKEVFSSYGTRTYLARSAQGSHTWTTSLSTEGEYWLQFGVWNDAKTQLLAVAPSPSQNLIKVVAQDNVDAQIVSYSPSSLTQVQVGQSVTLSVTIRNTGNVAWQFIAGASVWNHATGAVVNEYERTLTTLQPGQQTTTTWSHTVQAAGDYRVQFGAWKQKPFTSANLLDARPSPSQVLIRGVAADNVDAQIVSYSPSSLTQVQVGQSVTLSVTIRNTGNVAWQFIAGASVWNHATGAVVNEYERTLTTLQPGQQTTTTWSHTVQAAGDYRVQFGAWKQKPFTSANLLDARPSPSQVLIRGDIATGKHSLTISISGQGTTSPSEGTHAYDDGEQVTITASPASGWKFDRWGGDASGTGASTTVTMNSNKSITAHFSSARQTPPDPPLNLRASVGTDYVQLNWSSPASDGGSPLTGYRIYRGVLPGKETYYAAVSGTSFKNTAVTVGTIYYCYVTAVNSVGESDPSNRVTNISQLIRESATVGSRFTVDGRSYVELTLEHYIDPVTLAVDTRSGPIQLYTYGDRREPVLEEDIVHKICSVQIANRLMTRVGSPEGISQSIDLIGEVLKAHQRLGMAEDLALIAQEAAGIIVDGTIIYATGGLAAPKLAPQIGKALISASKHESDPVKVQAIFGVAVLESAKDKYRQARQMSARQWASGTFVPLTDSAQAVQFLEYWYHAYLLEVYGVGLTLPAERIGGGWGRAFMDVLGWVPQYIGDRLTMKILSVVQTGQNLVASASTVKHIYQELDEIAYRIGEIMELPLRGQYTLALAHRDWSFLKDRPLPDYAYINLASPAELRVYDSQGRVTGLINGEIKVDIPDSYYFAKSVVILNPVDSYRYEVVGTDDGAYGLTVSEARDAGYAVSLTRVTIEVGATHSYTIDWDQLAQNQGGIKQTIASTGDEGFDETRTLWPPIASFTCSPGKVSANRTINFNASQSYDPDGEIISYEWSFGDGNAATGELVGHAYPEPGEYFVSLVVVDNDGVVSTNSRTVQVTDVPGVPIWLWLIIITGMLCLVVIVVRGIRRLFN